MYLQKILNNIVLAVLIGYSPLAAITFDPRINDCGETLSITAVTQPTDGTTTFTATSITYTPNNSFSGTDTFTYTISDGVSTSTAQITVNVLPVAADLSGTAVVQGPAITIPIVSSCGTPTLVPQIATNPLHGTVQISGTNFIYTPSPVDTYSGIDTFTYTIYSTTDTGLISLPATVTVTIYPVAGPISGTALCQGTPITLQPNPLGTPPTTIIQITQPAQGSAAIVNNTIVYTPSAGQFSGQEIFNYQIQDGNQPPLVSALGNINVQVLPIARPDSASVFCNNTVTLQPLNNDCGSNLVITAISTPAEGTAQIINAGTAISYTAGVGFDGSDEFTYTISDGLNTSTALITITGDPIPEPVTISTSCNTPIEFDPIDPTCQGALIITNVSQPSHGTATIIMSGTQIEYAPAPGYSGTDSFTYTVNNIASATVTATITPTAEDGSTTLFAGQSNVPVTLNTCGSQLIPQIITQPAHGTLTFEGGQLRYTPAPGFSGVDSFTYRVFDGTSYSDVAVHTLYVYPVALNETVTTAPGTAITIPVIAGSLGTGLTITSVNQPAHGTVVISPDGQSIIYTPAPGFTGEDSFTYTITDSSGLTSTGTIIVIVSNLGPTSDIADAIINKYCLFRTLKGQA